MKKIASQGWVNRFAKLGCVAAVLASFGCATPMATKHQASSGRVAVVTLPLEPEVKFEGIGRGSIAANAIGCFGYLFNVFNPPAALAQTAACALPIAIGAAIPPNEAELEPTEERVRNALATPAIQDSLRAEIEIAMRASRVEVEALSREQSRQVARSRDYRQLHAQGIDRVLETAIIRIGTSGLGQHTPIHMLLDPPLYPYLRASARLIRTADNYELVAREFEFHGRRRKQSEWVAAGYEIVEEFEAGYRPLGAHISDSVFRIYVLGDQDSSVARSMGYWGLAPKRGRTVWGADGVEAMDSVQPTLKWERFPRESDLQWQAEEMARVKGVTYEVIVAKAELGAPGKVVYRREGITDVTHRIETTLLDREGYFWSVRARFELDGRERVTEWGTSLRQSTASDLTAPAFGYKFLIEAKK